MKPLKNLSLKRALIYILALAICALLCIAAVFSFSKTISVYANPTSEQTIDFGMDGITVDDQSKVNELITVLGGTSYNDLSAKLGSGVKDASNFASAKTVTLGGVEFNITYVSKADYTANGTSEGDIIVTLWVAESAAESQWGSDTTNNPAAKYPMNMYSSSLIRSTLAGGNYLLWDGDETLDGMCELNLKWQPFNAGGAFYNCLATPANMAWQETLSAAQEVGFDNNCPNEAWGTPGSGSFVNDFDFSLKQGYTDWKNDRIWLPAMSETGGNNSGNGLWNTNQTQRSNAGNASWLRSAAADEGMYVYYLNAAGNEYIGMTGMPKGVRPAVHLNLTSLYKFEVTVNDTTTKYLTIEEAWAAANNATTAATVKMYADATTTDTLTVAVLKHITLDLNGHMLKYTGSEVKSVITVNGNFTLKDSNTEATHRYNINDDGLWVFTDSGTETLSGGVITGGKASGVFADSPNMNGSVFTLENGNICGNTATDGGGVNVTTCSAFEMKAGKISGNTATNGGGVDARAYGSRLIITGGEISGNTATGNGGGILWAGLLNGFQIAGTPVITGNKASGSENNVCVTAYNSIKVTGALEKDGKKAQIGVYSTGEVATGFTQDDNPSEYFIPDNPENDCVYASSGTVYIGTHAWNEGTVTTPPTCTEEGIKTFTCNNCNATETEGVSITAHTVSEWITDEEATCTAEGSRHKECTDCQTVLETEAIEKIPHTLTHHTETLATTEADGNTEYWSCGDCENYFSDENGETVIEDKTTVILIKLTPAPAAPAQPKAGIPWWAWLLIVIAALTVAAVIFIIIILVKRKDDE